MPRRLRFVPFIGISHGPWLAALWVTTALSTAAGPTEPAVNSWAELTKAPGELTFIRGITGLVLTCPTDDLTQMLNRTGELPASRRQLTRGLLVEAWLDRAPKAAFSYWRDHRTDLPPEVQQAFYRKLALASLPQAEEELAKEKSPERIATYKQAIIDAIAEKNPAAALPLARSMEGDHGWIIVQVIASLARMDREKALAEAQKTPATDVRNTALAAVIEVWFETQPADALRWAAKNLPAEEAESVLSSLIGRLARKDFEQARSLAAELNLPAANRALESALGSLPPKQLFERAISSGWQGIPDYALTGMIDYAATQSPSEAVRFFKSVPVKRLADEGDAKRIATAWTLIDPVTVKTWAAALPDASVRDEVALRINSMLTEVDPKLALAQITETPPGPLQARLVSNTAKAFGKKDLPGALAWVSGLPPGPNQDEAFQGLAFIGAEFNPAAMTKGLAAMPAGVAKNKAYQAFAKRWSGEDVGSALNWFSQLPAGAERAAIQATVFESASTHAVDQALELAKTVTDRKEQTELLDRLAKGLATDDPSSALALAQTIPDAKKRADSSASVLRQLAQTDPQQAAKLVQSGDFGLNFKPLLKTIAGQLANSSPAEAATWLDSLRQDSTLKDTLPGLSAAIAQNWAGQDADQALAWIKRLPSGTEQYQALIGVAQGMARRFPQKAFDLVANDPSAVQNASQLQNIALTWLRLQPVTAAQHIASSNLPESLKKQLLGKPAAR